MYIPRKGMTVVSVSSSRKGAGDIGELAANGHKRRGNPLRYPNLDHISLQDIQPQYYSRPPSLQATLINSLGSQPPEPEKDARAEFGEDRERACAATTADRHRSPEGVRIERRIEPCTERVAAAVARIDNKSSQEPLPVGLEEEKLMLKKSTMLFRAAKTPSKGLVNTF